MPKQKTSPVERRDCADTMLLNLRNALWSARQAGCTQTIPRIRSAIKSAEGAARHAHGRYINTLLK